MFVDNTLGHEGDETIGIGYILQIIYPAALVSSFVFFRNAFSWKIDYIILHTIEQFSKFEM